MEPKIIISKSFSNMIKYAFLASYALVSFGCFVAAMFMLMGEMGDKVLHFIILPNAGFLVLLCIVFLCFRLMDKTIFVVTQKNVVKQKKEISLCDISTTNITKIRFEKSNIILGFIEMPSPLLIIETLDKSASNGEIKICTNKKNMLKMREILRIDVKNLE